MPTKLTVEFVRKEFEKEGYTLLTTEYKNSGQKLEYICSNGHKHSICWSNWQQGHRCPYCAGKMKKSIEFVRKEFKKEGYKLLNREYIGNHYKLDYICPNGHRHSITWSEWQRGCRCFYCANNRTKLTIDFIRSEFEKEGYKLLTDVYNSGQKLEYVCPKGHLHSAGWGAWQQGHRCFYCMYINNGIKFSGENNPFWKGGISCEPYCDVWLDKEFKESIKERDGNRCLNPDCWGTSQILDIHHINYVKKDCRPKNLITICRSCNSRANKDREWHQAWYEAIMYRRGEFKYECITS